MTTNTKNRLISLTCDCGHIKQVKCDKQLYICLLEFIIKMLANFFLSLFFLHRHQSMVDKEEEEEEIHFFWSSSLTPSTTITQQQ
jgi:hypothetical protein